MSVQHTLARSLVVSGVALRSGAACRVVLCPAAPGTGVVFVVAGHEVPAHVEHVVDALLATTLGRGGARVALVEHLLAAALGAGVDNLRVELNGDEVPVLDGGALGWLGAFARAGRSAQGQAVRAWTVAEPVRVEAGASHATLLPASALHLDITVDFPHPAIGAQRWAGDPVGAFGAELAWARTFGFRRDAERLQAAGIARGASLDNTLVFDDEGVMNAGGQHHPDEVVRHKALDALGDLALLGGRPCVRLVAHRGGHALHHALLHAARSRLVWAAPAARPLVGSGLDGAAVSRRHA